MKAAKLKAAANKVKRANVLSTYNKYVSKVGASSKKGQQAIKSYKGPRKK